jgi:hypothetical protein
VAAACFWGRVSLGDFSYTPIPNICFTPIHHRIEGKGDGTWNSTYYKITAERSQ